MSNRKLCWATVMFLFPELYNTCWDSRNPANKITAGLIQSQTSQDIAFYSQSIRLSRVYYKQSWWGEQWHNSYARMQSYMQGLNPLKNSATHIKLIYLSKLMQTWASWKIQKYTEQIRFINGNVSVLIAVRSAATPASKTGSACRVKKESEGIWISIRGDFWTIVSVWSHQAAWVNMSSEPAKSILSIANFSLILAHLGAHTPPHKSTHTHAKSKYSQKDI